MSPLLGVKNESQSFFDLNEDSKNLTIEKRVERIIFTKAKNCHMLQHMIHHTSKGC